MIPAQKSKERSTDRILVIQAISGKKPTDGGGLVDPRLFSGDNKLHAIQDSKSCLWFLKYERGSIPEQFKQGFTSFDTLLTFVKVYYKKRNLEIAEVID